MRIAEMLKRFWIKSFSRQSKPDSIIKQGECSRFKFICNGQNKSSDRSQGNTAWCLAPYSIAFIRICFFILFCWPQVASALSITLPGGTNLSGLENNFTFAKSIWTNSDANKTTFTANKSYLLLSDINRSGTLYVGSPTAPNATIKLYELVGTPASYSAQLVKTVSGANRSGYYHVSGAKEYLVETIFPGVAFPHVTFDFFPDGNGTTCTHLAPASGLTCDQSWLPAHFRKGVEPWIKGQFKQVQYRLGLVGLAETSAGFAHTLVSSAIDAHASFSDPVSVIQSKTQDLVFVALGAAGVADPVRLGQINLAVNHGLAIARLFTVDPAAYANARSLLINDAIDITTSVIGIAALNKLAEQANELDIAYDMLQTYIEANYGDWNALVSNAGLDPLTNPTIYQIIDGFAARNGYSNSWLNTQYDPLKVEALFNKGAMSFGDWVATRKILANPFDDVDGDGVSNQLDANPNDPNIPAPIVTNIAPVAVIAPVTGATLNTQITLSGIGSYDPDGTIVSYTWTLKKPAGSAALLAGGSTASPSFTPDMAGSYTATLIVTDNKGLASLQKQVQVSITKIFPPTSLVYTRPGVNSFININIGGCGLVNLGTVTVPNGETWKNIKFWQTSGTDIVLLGNLRNYPTLRGGMGCPVFTQRFNSNFAVDYGLANAANLATWNRKFLAGDVLYVAAFSHFGVTNQQTTLDAKVVLDADGDGVPDSIDAFPNNPAEQYDSDNDGIGNNADKFDNDVAASVDTDLDGYPDVWNTNATAVQIAASNLTIDTFPNNVNEWADLDGDLVGDNSDKFPNDIAASVDTDNDGSPEVWNPRKTQVNSTSGLHIDKFSADPAASLDTDNDGTPDSWNAGKSVVNSTSIPKLVLDAFPNDPAASIDSDWDGFPNVWNTGKTAANSTSVPPLTKDVFPNDPTEWKDSDNDTHGDNSDVAPNDPTRWSNVAPLLGIIVNQTVGVGQTVTVAINAVDQDGDLLTYKLLSAPAFVTLNAQQITITPLAANVGSFSVIVKVSDNFGGVDSQVFHIVVPAQADLSVAISDGQTSATSGSAVTYTIVAKNNGPNAVTGTTMTDTLPASLSGATWSCVASTGSSCTASGTGNIADTAVNLINGGTATYTLTATLSAAATGQLVNTATITEPVGVTDANLVNNSATDTDTIVPPNQPPVLALNIGINTMEDTPVVIPNTALKTTDADNTPTQLTYTLKTPSANGVLSRTTAPLGVGGTFTQADIDAGQIKYTPNLNYNGLNDGFFFTVSDGVVTLPAAQFKILVAPVNDPPAPTATAVAGVVSNGSSTTSQVSPNDPDVGDTHTFRVTGPPAKGRAQLNAAGLVTYTPNAGASGADQMAVTVTDQGNKSGFVMINVNITAPPDTTPPVITLTGANISVAQGGAFIDPGYSASDNPGAVNLTGSVVVTGGPVNTAAAVGTVFTLNYNVSDAAGNPAVQKVRTVTITDGTAPVITLTGGNLTVAQGGAFIDPGYSASDNPGAINLTGNVVVTGGPVNTAAAVGTVFTLNYNVSDAAGNSAVQKVRTVTITAAPDTTAPLITLTGNATVTIALGLTYTDAGATASDNVDGNLTNSIIVNNQVNTSVAGTYLVQYNVQDAAGNAALQVTRTVHVKTDAAPPVISLAGAAMVTVTVGAVYSDKGATALDNIDGNLTAGIVTINQVNTAAIGNYTVTYDVKDAAGNAATQVVRHVYVIAQGGATTPDSAAQIPLTGSAVSAEVYSPGQSISNFSATGATGTPPAGVSVPFGVLSYTATVPLGALSHTVNLSFSRALPANFELYKVDNIGNYTMIPNGAGVDQWLQVDTTTIALTLSDGGRFDLDGIANGVVVDPVAVGVPPAVPPAVTPAPVVASGGGGGCSINQSASFDPAMLGLILFPVAWLIRRRRH